MPYSTETDKRSLVAHNPSNTEHLGMQAVEFATTGDVYRRLRDYRQALPHYCEALAISLKIQAEDPNNADARLRIAAINNLLGVTLLHAGDLTGAAESYKQATHREEARSWHERSLKIWSRIKEPGYVSPEGFEPMPQAEVSARLAELNGKVPK